MSQRITAIVSVLLAVMIIMASGPGAAVEASNVTEWENETDWTSGSATTGVSVETTADSSSITLTGEYFDNLFTNPIGDTQRMSEASGAPGVSYNANEDRLEIPGGQGGNWENNIIYANEFDGRTSLDTWVRVQGDYVGLVGKDGKGQGNAENRIMIQMRAPDNVIKITSDNQGFATNAQASVTLQNDQPYWIHLDKTQGQVDMELWSDVNEAPGSELASISHSGSGGFWTQPRYWGWTHHSAGSATGMLSTWGVTNGQHTTDWKAANNTRLDRLKASSSTGNVIVRQSGQPITDQDFMTYDEQNNEVNFEYDLESDTQNMSIVALADDRSPDGSSAGNWTSAGGPSIIKSPNDGQYYILLRQRYADGGTRRGEKYQLYTNNTADWNGTEDWDLVFSEDMSDDSDSVESADIKYYDGEFHVYFSIDRKDGTWASYHVTSDTLPGLQSKLDSPGTWNGIAGSTVGGGFDNAKDPRVYEINNEYYMLMSLNSGLDQVIIKSTSGGPYFDTNRVVGDPTDPIYAGEGWTQSGWGNDQGQVLYDNSSGKYIYWTHMHDGDKRWHAWTVADNIEELASGTYAGRQQINPENWNSNLGPGTMRYLTYYSEDSNSQVAAFEYDPDADDVKETYIWDYRDDPGGGTGYVYGSGSQNATISATIQVSDDQSTVTDQQTVELSGTQNETIDLNIGSDEYVRVITDFQVDDYTTSEMRVSSYQLQSVAQGPSISNLSPPDGTSDADGDFTLSADISDVGFSTGDEVKVDVYYDNSLVKTANITSNQTVTHDITNAGLGEHTWHVEATDSTGQTATSTTHSIFVGSTLTFRDVDNPSQILDGETIEVEFDDGSVVTTQTTSNGRIQLADLPPGRPITVRANPQDPSDYLTRQVVLSDVHADSSVYLVNGTASTGVSTRFVIEDHTGRYPDDNSMVVVKRAINQSGTTEYTNVASGLQGVNGFTTILSQDVTYQIEVQNTETGDVHEFGAYTVSGAEEVVLELHDTGPVITPTDSPRLTTSPGVSKVYPGTNDYKAVVRPGDYALDDYTVKWYKVNESGQTLLAEDLGVNPDGKTFNRSLTVNETGSEIRVSMTWNASGIGDTVNRSYFVKPEISNPNGLLPAMTNIQTAIPSDNADAFTGVIAFISALITMGFASTFASTDTAALAGLGVMSVFTVIDWVPTTWVFAGIVAYAVAWNIRRGI